LTFPMSAFTLLKVIIDHPDHQKRALARSTLTFLKVNVHPPEGNN